MRNYFSRRYIRDLNLLKIGALISTAFALTACGFATSNTGSNEQLDFTKPQIDSVEPQSIVSDKDIDLNATEIRIKFSEDVKNIDGWETALSITPAIDGSWTYESASKTVIFKRASATTLPYNTTYKLIVSDSITDASGNALEQSYSYTFSTPKTFKLSGQVKGLKGTVDISDSFDLLNKQVITINNDGSTPNNTFVFDRIYLQNSKYSLQIKNGQDNTTFCSVEVPNGSVLNVDINIVVNCDRVVPAYVNAPNWNDYVKSTDYSTCPNNTPGCFHGGESRAFETTNATSCTNLSATDTLGLFDWKCSAISGGVKFTSSLKKTTGLRDLVRFDQLTWKPNSIKILDAGNGNSVVDSSLSTVWWNNRVVDFNANPYSKLDVPSTIFAIRDNYNLGEQTITANKIAIVTDTGTTYVGRFILKDSNFAWLEVSVNAEAGSTVYNTAITVTGSSYTTIRSTLAMGAKTSGIFIDKNAFTRITNTVSSGNKENGILLSQNSAPPAGVAEIDVGTSLENVFATNNLQNGIYITSTGNRLNSVTSVSNTLNGVYIDGTGNNNVLHDIASYNNQQNGVAIANGDSNKLSLVTSVSNNGSGIVVSDNTLNEATDNVFVYVTAAHNAGTGVDVVSGKNNLLIQTASTFNPTGDCAAAGECSGVTTLLDGTTYDNNYVGIKTDTTALVVPRFNLIDFSLALTNRYRAWGGKFDSGACKLVTAGDELICYERDFSLKAASALTGVTSLPGSTLTSYGSSSLQMLAGAYEVMGDKIGNDNGLCEANEACIYSPNAGSYQGHGSLSPSSDVSKPWEALGITLYKFQTNGY